MADAVQIARTLATSHPDNKLPCPICANTLNARNLESHLGKVHAGATATPGTAGPWRGVDRRSVVGSTIAFVIVVVASVALMATDIAPPKTAAAYLLIVAMILPFGIAMASFLEALRGKVSFENDAIVLGYLFGLRRRRIPLPATIVTGSHMESRVDGVHVNADINQKHVDVREGSYLRLESRGGKALTIAIKGDTMFRQTWDGAGFTAGKPRKWYDVKVQRESMVAIEYELASRGLLVPAKRQA